MMSSSAVAVFQRGSKPGAGGKGGAKGALWHEGELGAGREECLGLLDRELRASETRLDALVRAKAARGGAQEAHEAEVGGGGEVLGASGSAGEAPQVTMAPAGAEAGRPWSKRHLMELVEDPRRRSFGDVSRIEGLYASRVQSPTVARIQRGKGGVVGGKEVVSPVPVASTKGMLGQGGAQRGVGATLYVA